MRQHIDFSRWHLDIDAYLNPFIPAPPWRRLPRPVSHFLGYRGDQHPRPLGNLVIAFWSTLGVFCGVLLIAEVSLQVPAFQNHHAPIIVGSFGAAAVLEFCAIESSLAQPRNAILSQFIASVIGVSIAKLFALNPHAHSMPELGGALACAITTAIMLLTNTVHPPAGATALLAVTEAYAVGWWLIPIMLLGCVLMLAVALLINNIQRRFPLYWWTPQTLSEPQPTEDPERGEKEEESSVSASDLGIADEPMRIIIQKGQVLVPDEFWLSVEERELLEQIRDRIQ
ncbi:hypothetical protein ARAM_003908 [Aspergillus rambellii]|uniref:HPP transmembrane region domain-containing protein n=3 Tax=Aspergillus subgen. Nidulantes TaxID=2720870 RepID=A0A0F8UTG9_9EURO|nr:hypothetical protein ARAM_003908 [Aspergillus rambellii]